MDKDEQYIKEREKIAGELKSRMEFLQLNYEALGEKAGMKSGTVERIIEARFWPTMPQYLRLVEALEMERSPVRVKESKLP